MPRKEDDSLGQDFTRMGDEKSPKPPESQRSLGDQSTYGDAGSSVSDVGGLDEAFEGDMEVVDLSDRYEIEGVIGKGGMGEVLRLVRPERKMTPSYLLRFSAAASDSWTKESRSRELSALLLLRTSAAWSSINSKALRSIVLSSPT